jgi:6-pyruvoyl-tetrahydropterin synthase related domain
MTRLEATAQDIKYERARRNIRAKIAVASLCVALSAVAVIPFFLIAEPLPGQSVSGLRMPITHDMALHYDQMRSFYKGLEAGTIYPRWEEDTNRGFGAPTTSFYPPGIYYITAAMFALSGDWTAALMWAMLLVMMMSGAAIYVYARSVMSRLAAAIAMCLYILLPYHMVDQYQRGAIAELVGFVWMPLMLMFGKRLMMKSGRQGQAGTGQEAQECESEREEKRGRMRAGAGLAASYGMFVWSHPPTAYQFSLGIMMYVVVMGVMRKEWKGVIAVAAAMMLGLGLSAAYLLPAALEQDLIRSDHIARQYPYHDSYVLLFLRPNPDHYYEYLHLVDRMWIFGSLVILVAAITLLVFKPLAIRLAPELKQHILLWVILGCFATFMMTGASRPIGSLLPKIEIGVFAWRMLAISTLVQALLVGACAHATLNAMKRGRKYEFALLGSVVLWIFIGSVGFNWEEIVKPVYRSPAFAPAAEHMNLAMQPRSSEVDFLELPIVEPVALASGKGRVSIESWGPEHRSIQVELREPDSMLVRTFNFPGWTAAIDGEIVDIINGRAVRVQADGAEESLIRDLSYAGRALNVEGKPVKVLGDLQLGDITIELPEGSHRVTLDYNPTEIRRKAALITLASICLLMAMLVAPLAMRARH